MTDSTLPAEDDSRPDGGASADDRDGDVPTDDRDGDASVGNRNSDAPADDRDEDASTDGRDGETATDERTRDIRADDRDDAPTNDRDGERPDDHLQDLEDGSGCTEIWDHLSEKRAEDDDERGDAGG